MAGCSISLKNQGVQSRESAGGGEPGAWVLPLQTWTVRRRISAAVREDQGQSGSPAVAAAGFAVAGWAYQLPGPGRTGMAGKIPAGLAGSILVVSHDRFFLDRVVEKVLLHQSRISSYNGNYSAFARQQGRKTDPGSGLTGNSNPAAEGGRLSSANPRR